jgi:Cys-rich four helix bundle protein (predicted Tat secretion target)
MTISRRTLVEATLAAGAILAAATGSGGIAAAADEHAGQGMEISGSGTVRYQSVIDAALSCVNRGDVCLNHCITVISSGDVSMKDCIRTVSAMLPMCAMMAWYAALDATRLKDLAKVCIDVCSDCEAECKKHADAAFRACAESNCIKECKALVAV